MTEPNTYEAMIEAAAKQAEDLFRESGFTVSKLYLLYKAGSLQFIGQDCLYPDGYNLATTEALTSAIPYAHYQTWIRDRTRSVPCLPAE